MKKSDTRLTLLCETADAEHLIANCFGHLALLIKNGRISARFEELAAAAQQNKEYFIKLIETKGGNGFCRKENCRFCKIKAESFSLIGALQVSLELMETLITLYRQILKQSDSGQEKTIFFELIRKAARARLFLKREKEIAAGKESRLSNSAFFSTKCLADALDKFP